MIITSSIKHLINRIKNGDENNTTFLSLLGELKCSLEQNKLKPIDPTMQDQNPGPYPLDSGGFAQSFDPVEQEEEFVHTWQKWGMVVGKSILSPDECAESIAQIKLRVEQLSDHRCSLDNPSTWNSIPRDPNRVPLLSRGFLEIYHDQFLACIRQNIQAYIHHVLIWNDYRLWTSFDRVGVKLPQHEESCALPLHIDQNPTVHPGFKTVQGVLALSDCPEERGTFLAVPGSRQRFDRYCNMVKNQGEYVELDPMSSLAREITPRTQAIPLRAGDLVSWDSRTTHANTQNISDQTRFVIYLSAAQSDENNPDSSISRKQAFQTGVGSNLRQAAMHASKKPRWTDPSFGTVVVRKNILHY